MGMMIPQEGGTKFLGNKDFLGNGSPEKKGTKKGNAQPRLAVHCHIAQNIVQYTNNSPQITNKSISTRWPILETDKRGADNPCHLPKAYYKPMISPAPVTQPSQDGSSSHHYLNLQLIAQESSGAAQVE